jgi:hypothetical protein
MNKTQQEFIAELRPFFNHRKLSVNGMTALLGRQAPAALLGGMRLLPHDKRFRNILAYMQVKNSNVLRQISFACPDFPVALSDLEKIYGKFKASWVEQEQTTVFTCTEFAEDELIDTLNTRVEGYQFEDAEGGYNLIQEGQKPIFVPISELQVPTFTFTFKEFERPPDMGPQKGGTQMSSFGRR